MDRIPLPESCWVCPNKDRCKGFDRFNNSYGGLECNKIRGEMLTIYEKGNTKLFLLRIKRRSYNCGNCVLIEKDCTDLKCNIVYPCSQGYARYKFKEISEERYVKGR